MRQNLCCLLVLALGLLPVHRADAGPNHRLQALLASRPLRARVLLVDVVGQTVTVSTEVGRCTFDARNLEVLGIEGQAVPASASALRPGQTVILESAGTRSGNQRMSLRLTAPQSRSAGRFPHLGSGVPGSADRPRGGHRPTARAVADSAILQKS